MSKIILYTANSTSTLATLNEPIALGEVIRRVGCIRKDGNVIYLPESGYYEVTVNVTFTSTAGNVTFALMQNGVEVAGARSTDTIVTATTEIHSTSFSAIVRNMCCANNAITVEASGTAPTISNISVEVHKV